MKKILFFILCFVTGLAFTGCFDDGPVDEPIERPEHVHVFSEWDVAQEANCYDKGQERRFCKECGFEEFKELDYAHKFITIEAKDPTCEEVGYKEFQFCEECQTKVGFEEIPMTDHLHTEIVSVNDYYHHVKCTDCYTTIGEYTEHNYDEGVTTPAECLTNGKIVYTCEDCGHEKEETIWYEGHTAGPEATCTTDQICTVCEEVLAERKGHIRLVEGCADDIICAVCEEVLEEAVGHQSSGEATCTEHEYCLVCFENINYPTHKFVDHICSECGEFELSDTLDFELSFDTEFFYRVTGIGTSTDYLIIPNVYQGLPVKQIATKAFENDTVLQKVYIPSNVELIGANAFNGCTNLVSIFFAEGKAQTLGTNWNGNATVYIKGEYTLEGIIPSITLEDTTGNQAYKIYTTLLGQIENNYSLQYENTFKMSATQSGVTAVQENYSSLNLKRSGDTIYANEVVTASSSNGVTPAESYTMADTAEYYNDGYLYSYVKVLQGATYNTKQYSTLPITQFIDPMLTVDIVVPTREDFAKAVMVDNGDGTQSIILSTANGYTAEEICKFINFEAIPLELSNLDTMFSSPVAENTVKFTQNTTNGNLTIELSMSIDVQGTVVTYDNKSVYSSIGSTPAQICSDKSSYTLHNHVGDMNTCGEVTCRTCSNVVKEATDHTFDTHDCLSNTCTVCGEVVETGRIHIYENGECLYCGLKQGTNNLEYELSSDGTYYTVIGLGYSKSTNIVIPSVYEGLPVKKIGYYAFEGTSIEEIYIPDSVTTIAEGAFSNCASLKSLTIPASVTTISTYNLLNGCTSLETLVFGNIDNISSISSLYCDSVKEIIVLGGTTIVSNAFTNFDNLEKVEIGEGITSIGQRAFYALTMLKEVSLPETLETLGYQTFAECTSLESIVIPSKVKTLSSGLFAGCISLSSVEIKGNIESIQSSAFSNCTALESIVIPNSVTYLDSNAFWECTSLKDITINISLYKNISYNVKASIVNVTLTGTGELSKEAFEDATKLETVKFPEGMTTIPDDAFSGCIGLKSISIPDTVKTIGVRAFYNCTNLEEVILSDNTTLEEIQGSAFYGCESLKELPLPDTLLSLGGSVFGKCLSITEVVYPSGLNSIGTYLFYQCDNVTKITLDASDRSVKSVFETYPSKLKEVVFTGTSIREDALNGCTTVEKVVVTDTVQTINGRVFYGCTSLKQVELGSGLKTINNYAFSGCTSLKTLTLPASITNLSDFIAETEEVTIYYEGTIDTWVEIQYSTYYTDTNVFANVSDLYMKDSSSEYFSATEAKEIVISANVTRIGENALVMFKNLEKLSLPITNTKVSGSYNNDYVTISDLFMDNIPQTLTEVVINGGVVNSNGAVVVSGDFFENCTTLKVVEFCEAIQYIEYCTLLDCSQLEKIIIPFAGTGCDNIDEYGYTSYAFKYLFYNHNTFVIPETLTEIIITGGTTVVNSSFYGFSSLEKIELPEGLLTIGDYAFQNCTSLTELKIPSTVESIGIYAFRNCSLLEKINIPEGVQSIGDYALADCGNLKEITLPSTVTSFGEYAFNNCSLLEKVYYNNTVEEWLKITFGNETANPMYVAQYFYLLNESGEYVELTELNVPETVSAVNPYAFAGSKTLKNVVIPNTVSTIGIGAFLECTAIEYMEVPFIGESATTNNLFGYIFGGTYQYDNGNAAPNTLKTIKVTGGETVKAYAFAQISSLETLILTGNISSIEGNAIYGCENLQKVVVSKNVETLNNSGLQEAEVIEFEEGSVLKTIGQNAFSYGDLVSIHIPASVESIENGAFIYCTYLENVYYDGTIESWNNITFANNYSNPMSYATKFYLLDQTGEYQELLEFEIPSTMVTISSSLSGFRGVTSIVIPNTVTSIESGAFNNWNSLQKVYYKGTIEEWTQISFADANSNPMSKATEFYVYDANNEYYKVSAEEELTIKADYQTISDYSLMGLTEVKKLTIAEGVKSIGTYALKNNATLEDLVIPTSVTTMGQYAFYGCTGLIKLTIPFIGTSLDNSKNGKLDDLFYTSSYSSSYKPTGLTDLVLTGSVSIGGEALKDWSTIVNLTFPLSATYFNSYIFDGMSALTNFYYSGTIADWCKITLNTSYVMAYAENFYYLENGEFTLLTELVIPDTVITVKRYQFYKFKFTKLTIPANVTTIEDYAFAYCEGLTEVFIPATVTKVGQRVFYYSTNISKIYCEAESQPSAWYSDWNVKNANNHSVQWGATDPNA